MKKLDKTKANIALQVPKYSKKDIGDTLNNAVIKSGNPASYPKPLVALAARRLQTMSKDMMAPYVDFIDNGIIQPEEAVFALACAAFYIHVKYVLKGGKYPASSQAEQLLQGSSELPPLILDCPHCKQEIVLK